MVSPPVGSEKKINPCILIPDKDVVFVTLTWEAPQIECSYSALQPPSSPHPRGRSQISTVREDGKQIIIFALLFMLIFMNGFISNPHQSSP